MSAILGTKIVVPSSAASLTTLLGLSAQVHLSDFALRADTTNSAKVWVGPSTVTTSAGQRAYIQAGESLSISVSNKYFSTNDIYLVGNGTDVVYLFGVS